jgi:hypothetical protein
MIFRGKHRKSGTVLEFTILGGLMIWSQSHAAQQKRQRLRERVEGEEGEVGGGGGGHERLVVVVQRCRDCRD